MKVAAPLTISDPEESIPDEAQKIKHLGCPDTRQFEVFEMGGMIMVHEANRDTSHIVTIELGTIMNKACVAVLKANDGMHRDHALPHAFRASETEGDKT
jgi:hypothetical protein